MKSKKIIVLFLFCLSVASSSFGEEMDQRLESSRGAVIKFASELKGELMAAMQSGGGLAAIEICSKKAPEISAKISEETGWTVRRTALKTRNQTNAPDEWELKTLQSFEKRLAKGEDASSMEFSEVLKSNGAESYRYMKSIPIRPPCLNCHGEEISSKLHEKINELYPNDKAVDFKLGDIRGAFSITQPIK